MSDFTLAEAMINFASGTDANWNTFQLPIAKDVIVYTTNTKTFKVGDGNRKYSDLPVSCSIEGINVGSGQVNTVLASLIPADTDSIIFIDNEKYVASSTKLTNIVDRLTAISSKDAVQATNITTINSQFGLVDSSIGVGDNGKLAIIKTNKMAPGALPSSFGSSAVVPPITVKSVRFFSDEACTVEVLQLASNSTYFCKVDCQHDTVDINTLTITLTENNAFVTVTSLGHGVFRVVVAKLASDASVPFVATVAYNTDTVSVTKNVTVTRASQIITTIYGGSNIDFFNNAAIDTNDNVFAVGYTTSEGSGNYDAIVVKFDSNMNILAKKRYGGTGEDILWAVGVDSENNVICCGYTLSEGQGGTGDALIIKFNNDLGIIVRKVYGGAIGHDSFDSVGFDNNNNIIVVGYTTSEGTGGNALIIRFDSNLNILTRKTYGGLYEDRLVRLMIDSNNNIIAVGYDRSSSGSNDDALIMKFDQNLNILYSKRYGGNSTERFLSVHNDTSNNYYAVGYTHSEGVGASTYSNALIVKFDSNLNILARKVLSGSGGNDLFHRVIVDGLGNINVCGYTGSEGLGDDDALIVKFDSNLNVLSKKRYGGTGSEQFFGITVDSQNNIITVGTTTSEGSGSNDMLAVKFPLNIPSGTFTGAIITGLTLADSNLSLTDSALTLSNSALTLADSILTLANSNLTLADSNLTFEKETLN